MRSINRSTVSVSLSDSKNPIWRLKSTLRLIKSEMSVRPSVRAYIEVDVKVKVTSPSKLEIRPFSKAIFSATYNGSWQLTTDS